MEEHEDDYFVIGHCARRVLEIFTSAKKPTDQDIRKKIELLAEEFNIKQDTAR